MDSGDKQLTGSQPPDRHKTNNRPISPQIPNHCSICHSEPPVNAIQLDCGHIFCYLCIKSVVETLGTCALCRAEIGIEFNLQEHEILGATKIPKSDDGKYWFYEGFRGWWLYDADTNQEIEEAFRRNETVIERFIAGYPYIIDITNLTQQRKDGTGRCRKICRDTLSLGNILGMAGLKGEDFDEILDMMRSAPNNNMM